MKPRVKFKPKIDSSADEFITDPKIPAIAKEMNCGANFDMKFKNNAFYKGKKLGDEEVRRLFNVIADLCK